METKKKFETYKRGASHFTPGNKKYTGRSFQAAMWDIIFSRAGSIRTLTSCFGDHHATIDITALWFIYYSKSGSFFNMPVDKLIILVFLKKNKNF